VNIRDNEIVNNTSWGIDSENSHCACGPNVGNQIVDNTVELNGRGIELNWDQGTTVEGNYIENSGINLGLGNGLDNVFSINVLHNHFTDGGGMPEGISLGYGIGFHFEDNEEIGQSSLHCFINKTYGSNGSDSGVRGIGTNYLLSGGNEVCNHGTAGN
jgi:parallel beta-helix repeat protein